MRILTLVSILLMPLVGAELIVFSDLKNVYTFSGPDQITSAAIDAIGRYRWLYLQPVCINTRLFRVGGKPVVRHAGNQGVANDSSVIVDTVGVSGQRA